METEIEEELKGFRGRSATRVHTHKLACTQTCMCTAAHTHRADRLEMKKVIINP